MSDRQTNSYSQFPAVGTTLVRVNKILRSISHLRVSVSPRLRVSLLTTPLLFSLTPLLPGWQQAQAQLVPDKTLEPENSVVVPVEALVDEIQGGAARGSNLFHSFLEFNVGHGRSVYFANPVGIENILTRVTGNNASDILGRLGVSGDANLWLINPNGINFGPDASLDVRGSFVASTADGIGLGNNGVFSATNPDNSQLLTVEPGALFHHAWETHQAKINNQADLAVGAGETLKLQSGTVTMTGSLTAPGGRVEVLGHRVGLLDNAKIDVSSATGGGTALIGGDYQGKGEQALIPQPLLPTLGEGEQAPKVPSSDLGEKVPLPGLGEGFRVRAPNARRTYIGPDVTINADGLTNGDGGTVIVWADEITRFYGNISARGGSESGDGGFVEVSGKEQLVFRGKVDTDSDTGNIGTLLLDPTDIEIRSGYADGDDNGADAYAFGNNATGDNGEVVEADIGPTVIYESELEGQAANSNIILQATNDITIQDLDDNLLYLAGGPGAIELTADADNDGTGDFIMQDTADTINTYGRDITISGANLTLGNIYTFAYYGYDGGAITLDASGDIYVDNLNSYSFYYYDAGAGGAITLTAGGEIEVTGDINSGSYGYLGNAGEGGAITLDAGDDINLAGNLFSNSYSPYGGDTGEGGVIILTADGDINFTGDLLLSNSYSPYGDASEGGAITLTAGGNLELTGDILSSSTSNEGVTDNGGAITLEAGGDISTGNLIFSSSISNSDDAGAGGAITLDAGGNIQTEDLSSESRSNEGDGGDGGAITLAAGGDIQASNLRANSRSDDGNAGTGGAITLEAGGRISTEQIRSRSRSNFGEAGDGGKITLRAAGDIETEELESFSEFDRGNTTPTLVGSGGDIEVVSTGGSITTGNIRSSGNDGRGNITLDANSNNGITIRPSDDSLLPKIDASGTGDEGNITLINRTGGITLENTEIVSDTLLEGTGGDIRIEADSVNLTDSDVTTTAVVGDVEQAGNIFIETGDLFLDATSLATSVEPGAGGTGGDIEIAAGTVNLTNSSFIDTATFSAGDAGNVNIDAETISLDNNSNIFSTTSAGGNAGKVTLNATGAISLSNRSNLSTAVDTGATGTGGEVKLEANSLSITGGSQVQALTRGIGDSGEVILDIDDAITISGIEDDFASGVFTSTQAANSGEGGKITVATGNLLISEGAVLSAQTSSINDGGDININADTVELRNGGQLLTNAFSSGDAGDIFVNASQNVLITGTNSNPGGSPPPVPRAIVTTRNQGSLQEIEPNDSLDQTMVLSDDLFSMSTDDDAIPDITLSDRIPYVSVAGSGSDPATVDYYSFEVVAGTRGFFDIDNGFNGNDPNDPGNVFSRISLLDSDGNLLTSSIGRASTLLGAGGSTDANDAYLQFTFRESGTYFLKVDRDVGGNLDSSISAPGTYTLQVSLGNPNFAGNVVDADTNTASGMFARTEGAGTAGNITTNTPELTIENEGIISAATAGTGSAGIIKVEDANSVLLNNGSISTAVEQGALLPDTAVASNIEIETNQLDLINDSSISSATAGVGNAGKVEIQASDVSIDNSTVSSAVESSGVGTGGSISFETNTLYLNNNANVSSATVGDGDAGEVEIKASDVSIDNSTISSAVESSGVGNGGSISFDTNNFYLNNNASVSSATAGMGDAGKVEINASDASIDNSTVSSEVESSGVGTGGNVTFNTDIFSMTNNANISSATAGDGDAGEVEIKADRISIDNSSVSSAVEPSGIGTGGSVNLTAPTVEVINGASISASTQGQGEAGTIDVSANRFLAANGGRLLSNTSSTFNAGNIELTIIDDITLTGAGSGLFANTTPGSTGDGGSIFIDPITMSILDGAKIVVDSQGEGRGGEISIIADALNLDQGAITAQAFSDDGGDISIDIENNLLLRDNSLISTTAGIGSGFGNGGNINIAAQFVIGVPIENSDIIANAFFGDGGRIEITTNAIFGLMFREQLTPLSDITASSEFGTDGEFILNLLSFDATQGLNELPGALVDAESLVGKDACALVDGKIGGGSSFTITGRGGLPPTPEEPLSNNDGLVEWATRQPAAERPAVVVSEQPTDATGAPIYPEMRQAQGWIINPDGTVILTAEPQKATPHSPGFIHPSCN